MGPYRVRCAVCGRISDYNGCTFPNGFGSYGAEFVCHRCLETVVDIHHDLIDSLRGLPLTRHTLSIMSDAAASLDFVSWGY